MHTRTLSHSLTHSQPRNHHTGTAEHFMNLVGTMRIPLLHQAHLRGHLAVASRAIQTVRRVVEGNPTCASRGLCTRSPP